MAWQDRLREAAYTSPSGKRVTFFYEDVRRTVTKKTSAFEFVDADGTYIQDNGHTGRKYPLPIFFTGDNHDQEADYFFSLLEERGVGKLEHPRYGLIDVVPFGDITQRDDLKTAANQTVFEITFFETVGLVFPSEQADPASDVLTSVDKYNDVAAGEFEDITSLDTSVEQVSFKNKYQSLLAGAKSGLQAVADVQTDVQNQFNLINDSINQGIDILVSQPLTLAFQTIQLIQTPALAFAVIKDRLKAYGDLARSLLSGTAAVPGNDSRSSNDFHTADLFTSTCVTGQIISVVNNQFNTKPEALQAAETIIQLFDEVSAWRDENYQSLSEIDLGGAYQNLQESVAVAAGFLVYISFTLKQERRIILERDRTIIDLVAELYGEVDGMLDFFISSNDLSGLEILELKQGREIVYYI